MNPGGPDRADPEGAIAAATKRVSNWGRWGADDVRGTMNFLDAYDFFLTAGPLPVTGAVGSPVNPIAVR